MRIVDKIPLFVKVWGRVRSFCVRQLVNCLPFFRFIRETQDYKHPITFDVWYKHKVLGTHKTCYWPIHPTSHVSYSENVRLGIETFPGYMPGCYIQAIGAIEIGDHSIFSANVGIVSSDHRLDDARKHEADHVRIGRYCLVGMNAVILPGVELGDFTVVGAGSVVTKSFPEGACVIAGNPARCIRMLNRDECVEYTVKHRYHGYLTEDEYLARFPDSVVGALQHVESTDATGCATFYSGESRLDPSGK